MPQAGGDEHYYKRRRLSANGAALVMLIFRRPHRIVSERLLTILIEYDAPTQYKAACRSLQIPHH
jgi:hypothetical protein